MSTSAGPPAEPSEKWHTAWYEVWTDASFNFMICFCPGCAYADTVTRLDGRYANWCPPCFAHTCATGILACALVGADTRRQIRETFRLPQEPCNDYLLHCLCCWCALMQEAREIKYRSQLLAPPSLAAQLVPAADAPEVQLMERRKSKAVSLKEWEWKPPVGGAAAAAAGSTAASQQPVSQLPPATAAGAQLEGPNGSAAVAAAYAAAASAAAAVAAGPAASSQPPPAPRTAPSGPQAGPIAEDAPLGGVPAASMMMEGVVEIEAFHSARTSVLSSQQSQQPGVPPAIPE